MVTRSACSPRQASPYNGLVQGQGRPGAEAGRYISLLCAYDGGVYRNTYCFL